MSLLWGAADQLSGITVHALPPSVGDSDLAFTDTLPISRDEWHIKQAIRENTVVAIKAETGSGKTMLGPQFLRQEVGRWPVLIVQKSCFAAEKVVQSLVECQDFRKAQLHLRTGNHESGTDFASSTFSKATHFSVVTYGILYQWLRT